MFNDVCKISYAHLSLHALFSNMESLRRVLDYKLVFDSLCDSNGMVRLETLTARWPANQMPGSDSKVPQGCLKQWTECADKDGYLDWKSFSTGLQLALSEDSSRLTQPTKMDVPQSEAEKKLASLRMKGSLRSTSQNAPPLSRVNAADIESFLSTCSRETLAQALKRMRKDVYKSQLSIHRLTTSSITKKSLEQESAGERKSSTSSRPASGNKAVGIATREREELTYGLEMLEKTRQWYKEKLKQLAKEESQNPSHSKTVKAEELLEVLERGTSTKSEKLQHIKEINTHLKSLSSPAPNLTPEQQSRLQAQLQKLNESRQERESKRDHKKPPKSQPVGAPPEHIGKAVIEFNTEEQADHHKTLVIDAPSMPIFPVLTSEELKQGKMPQNRAPVQSASMTEIYRAGSSESSTTRGTGYRQDGSKPQPRYASSQNISAVSNRDRSQEQTKRRVPKRTQSFTGGSPRSSKANTPSDITNSVTDYPASKAHRMPQQYPLRGTASMQELQPDLRSVPSNNPSMQGRLPKSSSVKNISSTSGYAGHSHSSAVAPGLMHQQVYSTGMSSSTQTLPSSRSSDRLYVGSRGHHGRSHSSHTHVRHTRAEPKATGVGQVQPGQRSISRDKTGPPQRLGDSVQSLV